MLITTLLLSTAIFAAEPTETTATTTTLKTFNKMTVKDAKAECKDEGKSGKELLECIKAKKSK